ncbi:dethiobiotin synthase [Nitratifractor sp.]
MQRLFVTATGTGVGKTHVVRLLLRAFNRLGYRVGACKAVETGVKQIPLDAQCLLEELRGLNPHFAKFKAADLCAYTFSLPAAPFCADRERSLDPKEILHKVSSLESHCDLMIIEGAGGLLVPLTERYFMIDLARDLRAHTLLVTPSGLGCINQTLLSLRALEAAGLPYDWCVNLYEERESFPKATRPYYDAAFDNWWSVEEGLELFCRRFAAQTTED